MINITLAENGFVIGVKEDDDVTYYFVALSVEETAEIVRDVLSSATENKLDLTSIAFERVPDEK